MAYNNFPIFTRRYPWEGIENFAFDALLGSLSCSNTSRLLQRPMRASGHVHPRPHTLKSNLRWTNLSEVARRSCKRRDVPGAIPEVEMYASELTLENSSDQTTRYAVRRRESDPSAVTSIQVGRSQLLAGIAMVTSSLRLNSSLGAALRFAFSFVISITRKWKRKFSQQKSERCCVGVFVKCGTITS